MKTILVFSGSQRKESHNQRLAAYLADLMSDSFQIDMLHPSDIEFPLFNQDNTAQYRLGNKSVFVEQNNKISPDFFKGVL